jgi:hypothetical protein
MRRFVIVLGLAACALLVGADRAECRHCRSTQCRDSASCGGSGCLCIKQGRDRRGTCYSVDALP